MATYTEITEVSLARFVYMFELGNLKSFSPITAGIENSNYRVVLDNDEQYVLTISEDLTLDEVPFFNDLFQRLINAGLPVPEPQRTLDGMASTLFKGKPTWFFSHLSGQHFLSPNAEQCREIGCALAKIHHHAVDTRFHRPNGYSATWARDSFEAVQHKLAPQDAANLNQTLDQYEALERAPLDLPRGVIHGDLFRDNALFEDNELTGVIDFYHACDDYLIQDIAVSINDWCSEGTAIDLARQEALLAGYESERPLTPEEHAYLMAFRKFSAMRFSLTRLLANSANPERQPDAQLAVLNQLIAEG